VEVGIALVASKQVVAAVSVATYGLLVVVKLVVGIAVGSVAVISEAIHSATDVVASVTALVGVRKASQPPDEEHPFGHGKIESLAGAGQAVMILIAIWLILNESVSKLLHGVELVALDLAIAVMVISAIANLVVGRWVTKAARETDSLALEAAGLNHMSDVLVSAGVAIGLVIVRITGLAILDPLIAIVVALFIARAAYDIARRSLNDLLDASLPREEQAQLREILDSYSRRAEHVVNYHQLRSRKSGAERHVDLHLVVKRDVTVQESHDLCDDLEQTLQKELGDNLSLHIHVEPCDSDCDQCHAGSRGWTRQSRRSASRGV
jgi:cation diffusion facilitator family transporter